MSGNLGDLLSQTRVNEKEIKDLMHHMKLSTVGCSSLACMPLPIHLRAPPSNDLLTLHVCSVCPEPVFAIWPTAAALLRV